MTKNACDLTKNISYHNAQLRKFEEPSLIESNKILNKLVCDPQTIKIR